MPRANNPEVRPPELHYVECPSCLNDKTEVTSPLTLHFVSPPVTINLCPQCHTQALRQPVTFRLRFSQRSTDYIKEVLKPAAV